MKKYNKQISVLMALLIAVSLLAAFPATVFAAPPVITEQPKDAVGIPSGGSAEFHIAAEGADITYQWQTKPLAGGEDAWTDIPGETEATLVFPNVSYAAHDSTHYRCMVSGGGESTLSGPAALTVAPQITTQFDTNPVSVEAAEGETAVFTAGAAGDPVTFQWQVLTPENDFANDDEDQWAAIPDATGAVLTLNGVTPAMNGNQYQCVVKNTDSSTPVYSDVVTLTVTAAANANAAPAIKTQPPANPSVTAGQNTSLQIEVTGNPAPTYQWKFSADGGTTWSDVLDGEIYSGATANTLTLTNVPRSHNGYQYRCTAANSAGVIESDPATLAVTGAEPMSFSFAAAEPSGPYTATIRYYDSVQLTYTLHYPNGGIWSGGADVPIGNMGTVADQIYCVDPFVPFHSRADSAWQPGKTQDGVWQPGATVDTKGDYTVAAPWVTSPAMRYNSDAVRWLVLNGYRGNYLADDSVSRASVARLQSHYTGSGTISREIALMATKFAVWKVLAGNNIELVSTSLNSSSERATFDQLVEQLYNSATAASQPDWDLKATDVKLTIDDTAVTPNLAVRGYEFYGPLTVSAALENPSDTSAVPNVDQVLLNINGPALDGVAYIADPGDPEGSVLPECAIYGTAGRAQYIQGSVADGVWKSQPFYVRVPVNRAANNPNDDVRFWSGLLTIGAMAMARDVPLLAGTPVTFVSGANGMQDWNAVQAFIGAANEGMLMNLYAENAVQTQSTPTGQIWIEKRVKNATPLDNERTFGFQILYSSTGAEGTFAPVDLNEYPVHGAASADATTFTLKNGGLAFIDGLPAEWHYRATETDATGEYSAAYEISVSEVASPVTGNAAATGTFRMDDVTGGGMAMVSFVNTRTHRNNEPKKATAHFYLTKIAARYHPDAEDPDIVMDMPFTFRVESSADGGQTWRPVDLTGRFTADDGNGRVIDAAGGMLEIVSHNGVFIELDADATQIYRVTEMLDTADPDREFTPIYSLFSHRYNAETSAWEPEFVATSATDPEWNANAGPYAAKLSGAQPDGMYNLQFVNINSTFHNLQISKTVEGNAQASDREKLFRFQILYTENTGLFDQGPIPLSYDRPEAGMLVAGIPEGRIKADGDGAPTILEIRHGETATIKSLPAGNYKVVELNGAGYTATYAINAGEAKQANGGETEIFAVQGDNRVTFKNTVSRKPAPTQTPAPEPTQTPDSVQTLSGTPRTGDDSGLAGWGIVLLTSALAILRVLVWRKQRHLKRT